MRLTIFAAFTALLGISHADDPAISVFQKDTRILFQGDSITDGNRGRNEDPNHILGHGYQFIIAAKYGTLYASRNLTFLNRGISGNKVSDLERRWQHDTLDLKPGVLSILIGINDHSANVPPDLYEQAYDKLLATTVAANPDIRLVICEPFTLPTGGKKQGYDAWLAGLQQRQQIVARLAVKYHAAHVRFQSAFDAACKIAPAEHWMWDGIHPTYSGHQLMADEWLRTVAACWPEKR